MTTFDNIRSVLRDSLQLGGKAEGLQPSTRLLGSLPELDSMAVVQVLTALEEQFGITIDDDDISAATFETVASLCDFVEQKLRA